jgi:hypothetical protein
MNKSWLIFLFFLMAVGSVIAQESEEQMVKNTIDSFFEAFHQQDSSALKKIVANDMVLQTIGKNEAGREVVKTENFSHFLKSIASIPTSTKFEEKLLMYNIQIDGAMANAWTSYEFWVNGSFSHCGVNSFQLFKDEGAWKIIYLIDTRRKEGCQ